MSVVYLLVSFFIIKESQIAVQKFRFSFLTVAPVCLIMGIAGNVVPIARAAIADLKIHNFRTAIGWSTIFIGFGWITPVFLRLIMPASGVLLIAALFQGTIIVLIWRFFSGSNKYLQFPRRVKNKVDYIKTAITSYKWICKLLIVPGAVAAIFAYMFSETAFFQIYFTDESHILNLGTRLSGVILAFGYAFGVVIQWIVYCSDRSGIKFGTRFSFISLIVICMFAYYFKDSNFNCSANNNACLIEGVLNFMFSFGFGFFVPSLFTLVSKKFSPADNGKLFGVIDTAETLALNISSFSSFLRQFFGVAFVSFSFFIVFVYIISFIFYEVVVKKFKIGDNDSFDGEKHEHKSRQKNDSF